MTALWALGAALIAFAVGLYSGHTKTFPFSVLVRWSRALRSRFVASSATKLTRVQVVIDLTNSHAVLERRRRVAEYIWGTPELSLTRCPDATKEQVSASAVEGIAECARTDRWTVRMAFDIDSKALVLTPRIQRSDTIVIYQQGHEGSLRHGRKVLARLLAEGFRVVALEMPLLGDNSQPVVVLKRHGPVRLQDHDYFWLLDHEYGCRSVRFFMEPVLACVNQLALQGSTRFAMLGSSGGGWTSTLYAALDPRIALSFPVASSLPFSLRQAGELADYENYLPELYNVANYPELYVLSAHGAGRRCVQIFNQYDTVAWSGRRGLTYREDVQRALELLGGGSFDVVIDDSWTGHGISKSGLELIVCELRASPVGR